MKNENLNFTEEEKSGMRRYATRGTSSLAKFTSANGNVYGTLALDTRRTSDDNTQELPVAVRIAHNGKTVYLRIGKKYTMEEWLDLCECEKQGRNKKAAERKELKTLMQKVENQVNQLIAEDSFSLKRIQELHQGKADNDCTIYSVWDSIIETKREKESSGTARCNKDVRRRFERDMGSNVQFADINKPFIDKWVKKMKDRNLSLTTIGISLRTFRAIVNVCIDRKLIKGKTKDSLRTPDITNRQAGRTSIWKFQPCVCFMTFGKETKQRMKTERNFSFQKKNLLFFVIWACSYSCILATDRILLTLCA